MGLDVSAAIGETIGAEVPASVRKLIAEGALGRKSGQGFLHPAAPGEAPREVALKVQRPGIQETVARDVDLLYFARDAVIYGLVVAGLIMFDNPFAVVALWVVSALVISGLFVIGHDAAHGEHQAVAVLDLSSIASVLIILHSCIDMSGTILGRFHYLLYFLAPAMNPCFLATLDADLRLVPCSVRVGQAVEIKLSALDSGSLHAGAADGPLLRRGALPYAIPADQG